MSCCFSKKDHKDYPIAWASNLSTSNNRHPGEPLLLLDIRHWRKLCHKLQNILRYFVLMRTYGNLRNNFMEKRSSKKETKLLRMQRERQALLLMGQVSEQTVKSI